MPPLEDVIKEVSSCTLPEEDKVSVCVKLRQAFTLTANKVKAQTRNGKCIGNQETVRYKLSVVDKNQTIHTFKNILCTHSFYDNIYSRIDSTK